MLSISPVRISDDRLQIDADLESNGKHQKLYFLSSGQLLNPCLEAFIPVGMLLAMRLYIPKLSVYGELAAALRKAILVHESKYRLFILLRKFITRLAPRNRFI
jgi:hypothetical protein